jgi:gamma-glutamylcyclotransferase (GGCT)/AIG2-like uncharacterized protein YtfP
MPEPLFVYGTLHPDRAPAEIASTVALFTPLGPATLRGRLLDLGEYPGLIPGEDLIPGELFAVPPQAWPALDAYETALFRRIQTPVTLPSGETKTAWVYLYDALC